MSLIYCVDDDSAIREIEVYTLRSVGFEAEGFADGAGLYAALERRTPALIILDIMLPGEDGISILKRLREDIATAGLPVIMATARGTEMDRIHGLDSGADDYLVKPFGVMEMVSRVKAVLRRCAVPVAAALLCVGPVSLDERSHSVTVNGEAVALTLKEYELLRLFMRSPGTAFSREQLLSQVWEQDYLGESRTVDMHIKTLRRKLGDAGTLIETVFGVGYRMSKL